MTALSGHVDDAVLAEVSQLCGISASQIEEIYACTPFQMGIAADSGMFDATYVQRFVLSLAPNLDAQRLCDAVSEVLALNQVLRTRVVDCQLGLVQIVLRDDQSARTLRVGGELDEYLEVDRTKPMGLAAPLFRSAVIESEGERKWVLTIHHCISDHTSALSLVADVANICQGKPVSAHAPFKHFVNFCNSVNESEANAFWTAQFKGAPSIYPSVPFNRGIDASSRSIRPIRLPANLASPALLPVYLECAWALLQQAYCGGDSVAYGVVYSGRNASADWEGTETTLGPTIATIPVEVSLDPAETVGELLKRRQLGRQAVQACGAAIQMGLVRIRKVSESAKRAAEFQTLLNIRHTDASSADSGAISFDHEADVHRGYAITLTCTIGTEAADCMQLLAEFDESHVSLPVMNRLLVQMEHTLQALTRAAAHTKVGDLPLLSSRDRLETLKWNNTVMEPIDETLHALVRRMASAQPEDVAVDAWDGSLTYFELVTIADGLAETLHQRGVSRQSVIPCLFEHSRWAVVAALAVLTFGGICMNLEPSHPRARHERLLELTKPDILLCSASLVEKADGLAPSVISVSSETVEKPPTLHQQIDDYSEGSEATAYIIFTSGSTGTPKGVVLNHRALATSLKAIGQYMGWWRELRALQFTSYVWDASIAEIFGTLLFGGCVCIPSAEARQSGLADYINAVGVNWVFQTPTGLRNLSPDEIPTVKTLVSGGERVLPEAAVTWGSKLRLVNGWGPCESSIFATFADLGPGAKFPETIGRPVGCAVWIADPINPARLLPIGAVGELIIESATVADGYFGDPDTTAAAFIDPPAWAPWRSPALAKARRFYRTGDLGRYNDDGSLHFVGRQDHQLKLRGQRLELGEIEGVIDQCPIVRAAVVVSHVSRSQTEVVAVLTLDDPELPRSAILEEHSAQHNEIVTELVSSVRHFATTKLPSYMVPTHWVAVQDFPRAASNKVDRPVISNWLRSRQLVVSSALNAHDSQTRPISPPASAAENVLRTVWSNVLNIPESQIGKESSFLRLGGDSITAMQVATRIRRLGMQLSVQTLMQSSSLSATAAECKEIPASSPSGSHHSITGPSKATLSPIQKLFMQNDGPAINNHFIQSWLLQLNTSASQADIEAGLQRVLEIHPMLRARFSRTGQAGAWEQSIVAASTAGSWRFRSHSAPSIVETQQIINVTQASFDIETGPVFAADLINGDRNPDKKLLFLAAHHLVCDIVSWRTILEDFEMLLTTLDELPEPTASFLSWVENEDRDCASRSSLSSPHRSTDLDYWNVRDVPLRVGDTVQDQFTLSSTVTQLLMGDACNSPFSTRPSELMLTAVLLAFQEVFPERGSPALFVEGHGRGMERGATDVTRTVGWFTTIYPISVNLDLACAPDQAIMATKDSHRSALQNQTWLRDQQRSCKPVQRADIELLFNFAGHLPQAHAIDKLLGWIDPKSYGIRLQNAAENVEQVGLLSVFCFVQDQKLHFWVSYNKKLAHQARIRDWISTIERVLCQLSDELPAQTSILTVSDLPILNSLGNLDVDRVNQRLEDLQITASNVESIYHCSAVQEGILFAQLKSESAVYRDRFTFRIAATDPEDTINVQDVEEAWRSVCKAHPILRTVFASGFDDVTAFQQIVLRDTDPLIRKGTLNSEVETMSFLREYPQPSVPDMTPPHRLTVFQGGKDQGLYAIFDISHAIVDAKSMHMIAEQFSLAYQHSSQIPRGPEYSDYITWAQARREVSLRHWLSHLADQEPCLLPTEDTSQTARPAKLQITVPYNNAAELNSFCQQHGVTIASFAQVAWALVLRRYTISGKSTPCFGCLHSGRDVIHSAENIVGPLLTLLISRFDTTSTSATPLDLMHQARRDSSEGSDKAGCSLGEIHEQLGLGTAALFNTIMSIQPAWPSNLGLKGGKIAMELVQADDPTEYAMTVAVAYSKESFRVQLSCQPEAIGSAFAEELARYFAVVVKTLLSSSNEPLAANRLFQKRHEPSPALPGAARASQYWTGHLSRVGSVSAFPSKRLLHQVLKDTSRKLQTTIGPLEDQDWTSAALQASWALCLSRLTGNNQVLFGVAGDCLGSNIHPGEIRRAILPYAVQFTPSTTPRSLSEDVRCWALECRPFIPEAREYLLGSGGGIESAGQVNNVLSIQINVLEADDICQSQTLKQSILPANSHPDDRPFGLAMSCTIGSDGMISLQVNFDSVLMENSRADLLLRQYEHAIRQMFQHLGDTGILLGDLHPVSDEEMFLLRRWSHNELVSADLCIHDEFSIRATELPKKIAVSAWDGEVSFGELDDLSSRLTVRLLELGLRSGWFVPLFFEKSVAAVVAMLAVMKAGAAFVPMDIKHPERRRTGILAELDSHILLSSPSWQAQLDLQAKSIIEVDMAYLHNLPACGPSQRPGPVRLSDVCYIIYTSGSTGKPKGIVVEHSNIATSTRSYRARLGMTTRTRTLQFANFVFDVALGDIFMTLLSGGCLFMPTEEERADATGIVKAVNRANANFLCLTPSLATLFSPEDVPTVETLALIGEPMRKDIVSTWADYVALVNAYAPSEATIEASCRLVRNRSQDYNNVGTPNGCRYWVVDEASQERLVPIGCPGELLIQGPIVASRYLRNPEMTKRAFIGQPAWLGDFPVAGADSKCRFYKTGDIVKQHADGSVSFLGRNDSQFKIRGQRVDLGEIEHHLRQHLKDKWRVAVDVVHWVQDDRDPSLICFLARGSNADTDTGALALLEPEPQLAFCMREALALAVPAYMIPDFFIPLRGLPATLSGKTDKKALRSIATSMPLAELMNYVAKDEKSPHEAKSLAQSLPPEASSPLSQALESTDKFLAMQRAWSHVLKIPSDSIQGDAHWFSIGGNSIKAMQLIAAARKVGLFFTVVDLFNNPVLADLERVASFGRAAVGGRSSRPQLLSGKNEHLFPLIVAKAPFLYQESLESVAVTTDAQAWMLAVGAVAGRGFQNEIYIDSKDGLNLARLRKACEEVAHHHPMLRTLFVQHEDTLCQVVLKDRYVTSSRQDSTQSLQEASARNYIPRFYYDNLSSNGTLCHRLRLTIHHALYDAMYLHILVRDIASAYSSQSLTAGLPFHAWLAQTVAKDYTITRSFWKDMLRTSSMTSLHQPDGPCRYETQSGLVRTSVPIHRMQSPAGTEASVLKAAWAIVLARELGIEDVVFGQVTANRSSDFLETGDILGPCVNVLPVRAYPARSKELEEIVREIDDQHRASIPHQELGFRDIIRHCADWPSWTRFGSLLVYQNHGSVIRESEGSEFRFGDFAGVLSGHGEPADASDVWVIAEPDDHAVNIQLRYIPDVVSKQQAERLARSLMTVLETGQLESLSPSENVSPADSAWLLFAVGSDQNTGHSIFPDGMPSKRARSLTSQAWREVKLLHDGVLPEADVSMFDCGADVVTALLLSKVYQGLGYVISVVDVVRNPTQRTQCLLLDKTKKVER